MLARLKNVLQLALAVVTILGLITFSLFILEEAFQTVMFGTWPAQDANDWDTVLAGTDLMEGIVTTLNVINYVCGWLQPLAFVAYRSYGKAARYYIQGLRSKVFALSPESFDGREHEFVFRPKRIVNGALVNSKITIHPSEPISSLSPLRIRAIITVSNGRVVITPENIRSLSVIK